MLLRPQDISDTLDAIGLGYVAFELIHEDSDRFRLIEANDAASRLTDMDMRSIIGVPIDDSMPSVRAAGLVPIYAEVARTGMARQLEQVRLPTAPMQGQIFRITAFPFDRRTIGLAFENVTERVNALEKIHFQSILLDAVGQAVAAVDLDGRVTYWNGRAERVYGWSAREAIGRPSAELVGAGVDEIHKRVFNGEIVGGEYEVSNRLGTPLLVNITVSPIRDAAGDITGCVGTAVDISEQRRAEAAARENDRRLRALVDAIPDVVLRLTPDAVVTEVTRSFEQLPLCEGSSLFDVARSRITPQSMERMHEALANAVALGGLQSAELELLDDGAVRHLELRLIAAGSEVLAIMSDITDRIASIRDAERRQVGLDLHDQLGQSLTALKLSLETAARSGAATEEQLRAAARRASDIIGEVRNVTLALRNPTSRPGLFAELGVALRLFARDTGVDIRLSTAGDDALLPRSVRDTAFRVAQEAVTNVARHAGVEAARVQVTVGPERVRILVVDAGKGFTPHGSFQTGTAGLPGMAHRVDAAGGTLSVRSHAGVGTVVEIELPIARKGLT